MSPLHAAELKKTHVDEASTLTLREEVGGRQALEGEGTCPGNSCCRKVPGASCQPSGRIADFITYH